MKNTNPGLWSMGYGEVGATLKALEDCGITAEHFKAIRADKNLAEEISKFIISKIIGDYNAVIDYDLSLAEMIAVGKYEWTNSEITAERFPVKGKGQVNINFTVKHFARSISTETALKELDEQGLRPATIEELLAFGVKYPNEQRKYPIVALGSVGLNSHGHRVVAFLSEDDSKRRLFLYYGGSGWVGCYRFLAVGK
jgi:hypothetical protein